MHEGRRAQTGASARQQTGLAGDNRHVGSPGFGNEGLKTPRVVVMGVGGGAAST